MLIQFESRVKKGRMNPSEQSGGTIMFVAYCLLAALQDTSSWPPALKDLKEGAANNDAAEIGFALVKDDEGLYLASAYAGEQGYHLSLVGVYAYSGERFRGLYQRFEESSGWKAGSNLKKWMKLPNVPGGTDTIVVWYRTYLVDHDWFKKTEGLNKWYTLTWNRFTTVRQKKDSMDWYFAARPTDTDLESWMREHDIEFKPGLSSTVRLAFKIEDIPQKKE
jgi:hypothetical protein